MQSKTHGVSKCNTTFSILFMGGLTISDQLSETFPNIDFALFDRDALEIERLKIRGLITQSEVDKAHDRLCKNVYNHIKDSQ